MTVLFTGCLGVDRPQSQPWYAQIPEAEAFIAQARYSDDGTLHVLGVRDGAITHGVFDDDEGGYAWDAPMQFTLDGQAYDPFEDEARPDLSRLDMALRPDSDEIWVWLDGLAGPLSESGQVSFSVLHPVDARVARGGLVFEDANTLLMSQADDARTPEVMRFTVSGDAPSGEPEEVFVDVNPLLAFCSAEINGNFFRTQACDGNGPIRMIDREQDAYIGGEPEDDDDIVLLASATVGAAEDYVIGRGLGNAVCSGPVSDDGRATVTARRFAYEGNCYGVQVMAAPSLGGDIREDGDQYMLFYANGASIVLDRRPPPTRERDITGTWCNSANRVSFGDNGEFVGVEGTSDRQLFNDISYRYNGEVLTIDYAGLTPANFAWDGPVRVRHWMVRAGDTLNAKSYTHEKYITEGTALSVFGGVYTPCQ